MNLDLIKQFRLQLLRDLDIDILAEVLAAFIIREAFVSEDRNVFFFPTEKNNRKYENDVIDINTESDKNNNFQFIAIKTSRYGIADGLPESFFIEYKESKTVNDQYGFEQIKVFKKALEAAYTFFKPIEKYYSHVRINRELKEYELVKNNRHLICNFFGGRSLKTEEEERFLKTMHLLPFVVGDLQLTTQLINYVLNKPVSIIIEINELSYLKENQQAKLEGDLNPLRLGVNSLLDNCTYTYTKVAKVTIEEITSEEFHLFAPYHNFQFQNKQTHRIVLENIEKYYFPLDIEVHFDLCIDNKTTAFKLDNLYKNGEGILGYSTKI